MANVAIRTKVESMNRCILMEMIEKSAAASRVECGPQLSSSLRKGTDASRKDYSTNDLIYVRTAL